MKYLIQNKDALARAIAGVVMSIITLLAVFGIDTGITEDMVIAVIDIAIGFICFFFNNPTSKENSEATGGMRHKKRIRKLRKQGKEYIGENFEDDIED